MTDQDWQSETDPARMINALDGTECERKLRLYACAYASRVLHIQPPSKAGKALHIAERYADGHATRSELVPFQRTYRGSSHAYIPMTVRTAIAPSVKEAALQFVQWIGTPAYHCELLRHFFQDQFWKGRDPNHWPATVVQLAESLYNGTDCAFALHDALLEAGHAELAEHFAKEQWHPKGCWVVDLILGKK